MGLWHPLPVKPIVPPISPCRPASAHQISSFCLLGSPEANQPQRCKLSPRGGGATALRTKPEESAWPHKFSCRSALAATKCHKGPQEATPGTRPPATPTLGRRPQLNGQPTTARTSVPARSVKSIPLSNPEGPRRDRAAGQHTQHFGSFVPRCKYSPTT